LYVATLIVFIGEAYQASPSGRFHGHRAGASFTTVGIGGAGWLGRFVFMATSGDACEAGCAAAARGGIRPSGSPPAWPDGHVRLAGRQLPSDPEPA
jgi:hypothetical protein